jgi:DNA polymerase-3 subunit beta
MTLVAISDEIGDSTGSVDATVDGPAVTILFNVHYVAQALATIDTPEVVLELNNAQAPGRMSPMGHTETCAHILMPLYSRG